MEDAIKSDLGFHNLVRSFRFIGVSSPNLILSSPRDIRLILSELEIPML